MTVTRSKTWKRALVILAAIGLLTALNVTPAHAGDAGRNCRTYWHLNDPSTGWGFTLCVKLQHDPNIHTWRANGSVTTTTAGMVLHTATTNFYDKDTNYVTEASKGPAATAILDITTTWYRCQGVDSFLGWISEWVTWPDRTSSPTVSLWTKGNDGIEGHYYTGSC